MSTQPLASRHDYHIFVEKAIEEYKDSVSRSELLSIGDEAIRTLRSGPQVALTELLVLEEVDKIIAQRLTLPSYATWRSQHGLSVESRSTILDVNGEPIVAEAGQRRLIVAAEEVSKELLDALARDPRQLFALSPRKFEHLVAELLARDGFDVETTAATRDGGKDVVARMRTAAGCFVVYVECKRYAADRPVGVSIARELVGVLHTSQATSGLLVTTSSFSRDVHRLRDSVAHRLSLKAYDDLVAWIKRVHLGRGT